MQNNLKERSLKVLEGMNKEQFFKEQIISENVKLLYELKSDILLKLQKGFKMVHIHKVLNDNELYKASYTSFRRVVNKWLVEQKEQEKIIKKNQKQENNIKNNKFLIKIPSKDFDNFIASETLKKIAYFVEGKEIGNMSKEKIRSNRNGDFEEIVLNLNLNENTKITYKFI